MRHLFGPLPDLRRPAAVEHFVACEGVVTYKQTRVHFSKFFKIWSPEVKQHGQDYGLTRFIHLVEPQGTVASARQRLMSLAKR